ncbi:MotA/TolQ/ExbB proton channel family protein [hydrothermal vent metagenome]|uniref:MotA/TolQ/ExbB proton channel family protein n=1 Tax=hydrothermal vent metagenome TaxID=652676 RepID=A0A3B1DUX2_9ZZZZ
MSKLKEEISFFLQKHFLLKLFAGLTVICLLSINLLHSPLIAQENKIAQENNSTDVQIENKENTDATEKKVIRKKKVSAIPSSPAELIAFGWVTIAPFFLASVIALWFAIERLVVLRKGRVIPRPFVERFLQHLEHGKLTPENALTLCNENGSPIAEVFAHGVRKWGKPSVEVEQAIIDGGERQVSQLRKHLRVINGVATITPLMGLLGTVIGMIFAFNKIASSDAMGNPAELAVGIGIALLTTAAGLSIAIPSLILYMYLAGRVDALVMEMDLLAQNVVHFISAESLAGRKKRESKPSPKQPAKTT